jgi:hypothetical protein
MLTCRLAVGEGSGRFMTVMTVSNAVVLFLRELIGRSVTRSIDQVSNGSLGAGIGDSRAKGRWLAGLFRRQSGQCLRKDHTAASILGQ